MAINNMEVRNISDVGNVLLKTLIERKEKVMIAEKILNRWSMTTILCLILSTLYMYLNYYKSISFLTVLSSDFLMFVLIAMFAICIIQIKLAKKKLEKVEDEYDKLRYEIIERAEEIWNTKELMKERDKIYNELLKEYDVNLYYK